LLPSFSVTVTVDVLTPPAGTEVGEATTVELVGLTEPTLTVTLALPEMLPEVATTVPAPAVSAVKSPEELTVPIPPVTDHAGVIGTVLP
jgi:hypothetical protein